MEALNVKTKVPINTQMAPDISEATTKTVHPSTLSTIVKTKKDIKNLQPGDGIGVAPMVK